MSSSAKEAPDFRALLAEAVDVIDGLVDQQGMADNWFQKNLDRFKQALSNADEGPSPEADAQIQAFAEEVERVVQEHVDAGHGIIVNNRLVSIPPFSPWLIERKDNNLFDLYGTTNEHGKPWRRPHILAVDVDPLVAAWLASTGIALPSFTESQSLFRAERGLDAEPLEERRAVLDAVIAGLERRRVPESMIAYLRKRFEERTVT